MVKKVSDKFYKKNHSFSKKIRKKIYEVDSGLAEIPVEEISDVSLSNLEKFVQGASRDKAEFLFEKQKQIFDILGKYHLEGSVYFSKDFYSGEHKEKFESIRKKYNYENGIDYSEVYSSLDLVGSIFLDGIEKILGGSNPEDAHPKLKYYKKFEKGLEGLGFYSEENHKRYAELKKQSKNCFDYSVSKRPYESRE